MSADNMAGTGASVRRMECHQQREGNTSTGLTHAVPSDNPAGPALCGLVVHDQSQMMWRSVSHAQPWEAEARSARCPRCEALAPV
jgi:hypothetical protein